MVKIGVTGSRNGMSDEQMKKYIDILSEIGEVVELHHGDCVGVDVQAAFIADEFGMRTVAHPPINESLRAFHKSDTILPAKDYLDRNRDIVDAVDILVAFPNGPPKHRSGTWYTIRYAKKVGKETIIMQ